MLANRIDGNLGMLGDTYPGTFDVGDAQALADWLVQCRLLQCRSDQAQPDGMLAHLRACCVERAPLFEPQAERAVLHRWVQDLWTP